MRTRAVLSAVVLLAVAVLAAGCGDGAGGGHGVRVVATTTQLGDIARQIAGPRAHVAQILQPNTDPHEYEPRPSDARALVDAKVVLRSGGDVDSWLAGVLANAGSDVKPVTVIDHLRARHVDGAVDPHWWENPRNGEIAAEQVRDALSAADPAGRARYAARARAYVARLRALDRAIAGCMSAIPRSRRRLVTDHDALGYFAERYGIDVIGTVIPALATSAESSAGEVTALIRTIRREHVSTIFPESSVNQKLERAIATEAGARIGPALYADSLGRAGSPGATYLGALRFNAAAIIAGFTRGASRCSLPR
jgi:ABC-type Zn uptake system ZnuABC Zn-binding protein ZnuA